jgi:Tol biopolymer transport system component
MQQSFLIAFAGFSLLFGAAAQSVSIKAGNVCFTDSSGRIKQLTSGGHDSKAVLSPDGRWVVFVRAGSGEKIQTGADNYEPTELWQIGVNGKDPTLLVRCRNSQNVTDVIARFDSLQFSADGRYV